MATPFRRRQRLSSNLSSPQSLKHVVAAVLYSSRCNHNPVRSFSLRRFEVAPDGRRWNNCVHNSYPYVHRLPLPLSYCYGDKPWRAPLLRTLREVPSASCRLRQYPNLSRSMRCGPAGAMRSAACARRRKSRASHLSAEDQIVQSMADACADQMASRPCHLVLRAIPAGAERSGLQDLRRTLSVPVQLLLRRRRPTSRASATRLDHEAGRRGCRQLSRPCRCRSRAADRASAGGRMPNACLRSWKLACIMSSSTRNC